MFRTLLLIGLLTSSSLAETQSTPILPSSTLTVAGTNPAADSATLPVVPFSAEKRPFALGLGIVLVLVTFHRAFRREQRA